jgi:hypothetical protein
MKKAIYTIALTGATLLSYGQSPAQKEVAAKDNVVNAEENLKLAKQELNETYPAFKKDAEAQIKANTDSIEVLRAGMVKPRRSPANDAAKKRIDEYENRNDDLRNRLYIH